MRIRHFEARTMREAIAQVKRELGPNAVILSARQAHRGLLATRVVEVTAGIEEERERIPMPPSRTGLDETDVERIVAPLKAEMRSLRSLVRLQAEVAIKDRNRTAAPQAAPVPVPVSGPLPPPPPVPAPAPSKAMSLGQLTAPARGRVVVVTGAPGVGKTTTIAKLASRDALIRGTQVALITTDAYRVGGVEQIRAYAELIGVPLETVGEVEDLWFAFGRLQEAERIYVDTGGRSRLDMGELETIAAVLAKTADVEVHLAISACASARQMEKDIERYRFFRPSRLIFTKCDEADDLTELVQTPARCSLPVSYITTGQRVPEDIEEASPDRLVELAKRGQLRGAVAA